MSKTHFIDWTRMDDAETDVTVAYTISGGCPAHYGSMTYAGHPAEAAEVEIGDAWIFSPVPLKKADRVPVTLTDAELEKVTDYILENHEDDDDPDDARERKAEQQRDDDLCDGGPDEF